MARTKARGTLVDYLVAAIVPALIMIMVGSLMFFLLELWYHGPFLERLRWILFWFVLGIVLITRVGMQIGSALARGYAIALGGAVAVVATVLTGFHPLLLAIMGGVWWVTHKLTYDCTLGETDQDAGVGLLQESGLDPSVQGDHPPAIAADDPSAMHASVLPADSGGKTASHAGDGARRPHAPGVWLVYFTVGSLPWFGLGQWFVPAVEEERRTLLFAYFLAYLASGMGLLLSTSFLNLRRYLRQRRVAMPAAMAATWLTMGSILIAGLTVLAAFLPLPGSGLGIARGSTRETSGLGASRLAVIKNGGVQGEGAPSAGQAASKAAGRRPEQGKVQGSGESNDRKAAQQTSGQGEPGGSGGPARSRSGTPRGKPSASQAGSSGKSGAPQEQAQKEGEAQGGREQNATDQTKSAGPDENAQTQTQAQSKNAGSEKTPSGPSKKAGADSSSGGEKASRANDNSATAQESTESTPANPPSALPDFLSQSPTWLRAVMIIAGALILFFVLYRYGAIVLKALRDLIASLLGGLWIAKRDKRSETDDAASAEPVPPPRPFASFTNPFEGDAAERYSPDELVVYSFRALEAWAVEQNLARSPNETPTEFVRRLGQARADLRQDATRLVGYFVTVVYGQRGFRAEVLPALRQFWRALEGLA
jgi:hypothetical protein